MPDAGGLIFAATTARFANLLNTVSTVVFPQRFSGDDIPIYVVTSRK